VFPRFHVWNPGFLFFVFCFLEGLFSSFASPGRRIARIAIRAPNGIPDRVPTTPGEVPTGVGRTATWYM
jgi:hypothetical protein